MSEAFALARRFTNLVTLRVTRAVEFGFAHTSKRA
eukprot:SAG11_NODE_29018_length_315_cov_0.958333_1_plen_34_part_10